MTVRRLFAIAVIFFGATVAWAALGSSLVARSGEFDSRLSSEVNALWGGAHRQVAPTVEIQRLTTRTEVEESKGADGQSVRRTVSREVPDWFALPLDRTRAAATLDLAHRQKGLLWFSTYEVAFDGAYTFHNPDGEARSLRIRLPLPAANALFDDVALTLDGQPAPQQGDLGSELAATTTVAPGASVTFGARYRSRGVGTWTYAFAREGVAQVRDFELAVTSNVADIDFTSGSVSPSRRERAGQGDRSTWTFANLITGKEIGIVLPEKLNPGPFAARVTFFAPVSLLFFLTVMVMVGVTTRQPLHPMHYWFLSAAFFAFHLLLAYLVDHVSIPVAFAVATAVSMFLVVSYLRVVTGLGRAIREAAAAQFVFLVLFGYAFFFEGFTGLAVTIGAIVTLFVLMQMTARLSWDAVFGGDWTATGAQPGGRDVAR